MSSLVAPDVFPADGNDQSRRYRYLAANRLMAKMSKADLARLLPYMTRVHFPAGTIVHSPNHPTNNLYFLNTGAASVTFRYNPRFAQVQTIGPEGLLNLESLLGDSTTETETVLDTDGVGWSVSTQDFLALMQSSVALRDLMARYTHYTQFQLAFFTRFTAGWLIPARVAAYALMVTDRVGEPSFRVTHELITERLAVRRPGVTVALHILEGEHLILSQLSRLTVLDRDKLVLASLGAYGLCEEAYENIMDRQM